MTLMWSSRRWRMLAVVVGCVWWLRLVAAHQRLVPEHLQSPEGMATLTWSSLWRLWSFAAGGYHRLQLAVMVVCCRRLWSIAAGSYGWLRPAVGWLLPANSSVVRLYWLDRSG